MNNKLLDHRAAVIPHRNAALDMFRKQAAIGTRHTRSGKEAA